MEIMENAQATLDHLIRENPMGKACYVFTRLRSRFLRENLLIQPEYY